MCQAVAVVLVGFLVVVTSPVSATKLKYVEAFSKVPWQEFPGGRYKASTNATLTATTIAGAVTELKPGGVRELHWHNAVEWAMVINGTCLGTVLDESKTHPTDTWNFTAGDVWYFPANLAHSLVGLEPEGCLFVSGYKSPDFDELKAFSASSWLATLPVETLAQAMGQPVRSAQQIKDRVKARGPTFIPNGYVKELLADKPSLPVQWPKQIHRFPLKQNGFAVTNGDGSYINKADVSVFPVSTEMSGALVRIAPGGMRQLHWHLNFDEWQFVISGTVEAGVFLAPGESATGIMYAGDVGFAPQGSGHYLRNLGKDFAHVVLIFNSGEFTNVDLNNFLGAFPPSWTAASLNVSTAKAQEIDYNLPGFAPALKPQLQQKASSNSKPQQATMRLYASGH